MPKTILFFHPLENLLPLIRHKISKLFGIVEEKEERELCSRNTFPLEIRKSGNPDSAKVCYVYFQIPFSPLTYLIWMQFVFRKSVSQYYFEIKIKRR